MTEALLIVLLLGVLWSVVSGVFLFQRLRATERLLQQERQETATRLEALETLAHDRWLAEGVTLGEQVTAMIEALEQAAHQSGSEIARHRAELATLLDQSRQCIDELSAAPGVPSLPAAGPADPRKLEAAISQAPNAAQAARFQGIRFNSMPAAISLANVVRFLAVTVGGVETGFSRISPSLDDAARTLGETASGVLWRVHFPIARPALATAGLLALVDCMKELPATLLLRSIGFETLATHLYAQAARGTYEDAAIAALLIVIAGLLPVVLLARIEHSPQSVNSPR